VPRVVNVTVAACVGLLLGPLLTDLGGKPAYAQIALVLFALPFLLLGVLCLVSAIRPGSLGRAARRARSRRK
jgi:hypothetical protein